MESLRVALFTADDDENCAECGGLIEGPVIFEPAFGSPSWHPRCLGLVFGELVELEVG